MILFDLVPSEGTSAYQQLQISNLDRQYDFLESIVDASLATGSKYISQAVIKAFNYHAIVCLHSNAGEYRPCEVTVGDHKPPMWIHVQAMMDDFVNRLNTSLASEDGVTLAAWALWRLNWIHPFVNGNGRTARLAAYYVLCLKFGGLLPGNPALPELLRRHRGEPNDPYVAALRHADASLGSEEGVDLSRIHSLISELLDEQVASA